MNVFTGQHWRCRNREQIYGHGPGEEGEGEMNGENGLDGYPLLYVKQIAEFAV